MGRFSFKIAKRGRSVYSQDLNDFDYHSDMKVPKVRLDTEPIHSKIIPIIIGAEPAAGVTRLYDFGHEYKFVPGVISYFSFDNRTFFMMPFRFAFDFFSGSYQQFILYADGDSVYLSLERVGSGWEPIAGTTVYVKFMVLDVIGMV